MYVLSKIQQERSGKSTACLQKLGKIKDAVRFLIGQRAAACVQRAHGITAAAAGLHLKATKVLRRAAVHTGHYSPAFTMMSTSSLNVLAKRAPKLPMSSVMIGLSASTKS